MKTQLLHDHQWVNAENNASFERRHPVDNALVTEASSASVADATKSAESAHAAFKAWRNSPPSERRRLLLKTADILESMTPQFIEVMAAEVGASPLWAGFNVHLAANVFREAASLATQIQGETLPTDKPGALSMTLRQIVQAQTSYAGLRSRSYIGIYTVRDGTDDLRQLIHGTTLHGVQRLDAGKILEPTTYYGREAGVGLALAKAPTP